MFYTIKSILVPVGIFLGLRSTSRLGHDDLVNAKNCNGCFRCKSESPFFGLFMIIDSQFGNLFSLTVGDVDSSSNIITVC